MNENEYILEINVTKDNVKITNKEKVHNGEYKATKCVFAFSEDYEGLTKKAIFEADDVIKEMPIISNECDIPEEVLQDGYLQCNLRVYGYDIEEVDGEMTVKLRYSPTYDTFPIWKGSFIPNAEQGEEITPTQFEQYTAALSEGLEAIEDKIEEADSKIEEIDTALENVSTAITQTNNLNLDVNKVDDTATVTLTKKDGTTKTVEITDGKDGQPGQDGYTPVKGVDYYTEEEIQEIVNEITEKAEKDVNKANMIYNALPKVTGSGEEITLNNTAETPLGITLKGNTYQETTTGKNLLPNDLKDSRTSNGITFTYNEDGTYTLNGQNNNTSNSAVYLIKNGSFTLPAGTYYTISSSEAVVMVGYDGSSFITLMRNNLSSFTLNSDTTFRHVYLQVAKGISTNFNNYKVYPMISTSGGDYEPYTNGASPNPNYPQEVQVVSGDNTIKVEGKNLFNPNILLQENNYNTYDSTTGLWTTSSNSSYSRSILYNATGGTSNRDIAKLIHLLPNTKYTLKFYDMTNNTGASNYLSYAFFDTDGVIIDGATTSSTAENTFTTPNQDCYLDIRRAHSSGTLSFSKIQLEVSASATSYVPYAVQTYPINLGTLELCKIGDYQDYIYGTPNEWYKKQYIGKYIFDGTENWISGQYGTNSWQLADKINVSYDTSKVQIMSPLFRGISNNDRNTGGNNTIYTITNTAFYVRNTNITTKAEMQAKTNGTPIYYALANPTGELITDTTLISQLNNLYYAYAYQSQTNISQENSNLASLMSAETTRDLSNIFTNEG